MLIQEWDKLKKFFPAHFSPSNDNQKGYSSDQPPWGPQGGLKVPLRPYAKEIFVFERGVHMTQNALFCLDPLYPLYLGPEMVKLGPEKAKFKPEKAMLGQEMVALGPGNGQVWAKNSQAGTRNGQVGASVGPVGARNG